VIGLMPSLRNRLARGHVTPRSGSRGGGGGVTSSSATSARDTRLVSLTLPHSTTTATHTTTPRSTRDDGRMACTACMSSGGWLLLSALQDAARGAGEGARARGHGPRMCRGLECSCRGQRWTWSWRCWRCRSAPCPVVATCPVPSVDEVPRQLHKRVLREAVPGCPAVVIPGFWQHVDEAFASERHRYVSVVKCTHAHTHAHTHSHAHTPPHTHTHTHTHTRRTRAPHRMHSPEL
jgi:hypothetical protein